MTKRAKEISIVRSTTIGFLGTTALVLVLISTVTAPAGAQSGRSKEKAITQPASVPKAAPSPRARRTRVRAASQDYDESSVVACLKAFQQYKSQQTGARFVVRFSAGYYHCTIDKPQTLPATAQAAARPAAILPALITQSRPSDLRLWFSQPDAKIDGQVVAQGVNKFVTEQPINPYSDTIFDFVFDPHGVDRYHDVAVQFFRATPDVQDVIAEALGQKPSETGNPCAGWDTSPELIEQFFVPVKKATAKDANPAWGQVRVDLGKMLKGIPNHSKMDVYVRIVPVKDLRPPIRGIPAGGTCMFGPSTNVVLLKAEMNDISQNIAEAAQKQKDAETAYAAALKQVVGDNPAAKSPITVELLSFFPTFIADTYDASDELVTLKAFQPTYFDHAFPKGCAFNALEYSTVGPPKHWYDPVVEVIDGYAQVWSMMENFAADVMVEVVTAGKCTPPDPTSGAGGSSSQTCKDIYGAAGAGVRIAATTIGLPPSLPTVSGLADDGLEWVASQGVDFALSNVPGGELLDGPARDALIEKVKDQERQALSINACTFVSPGGPETGQGGWSKDPDSGCYVSDGQIYSLGKKNLAMYPRDAMLYLRVKKNPGGLQFSSSVKLHVSLGDYFDAIKDSYYGHTPSLDIPIDVARIPDKGFVIPVTFFPNLAMFLKEGKQGFVSDSGYAPDQARDAWIVQAYQAGKASRIQITTDYKWTNDGALIAGTKHAATVTAKFSDQQVPINKEIAFDKSFTDSARVTSPAPCPGFAYADNPPHKTFLTVGH